MMRMGLVYVFAIATFGCGGDPFTADARTLADAGDEILVEAGAEHQVVDAAPAADVVDEQTAAGDGSCNGCVDAVAGDAAPDAAACCEAPTAACSLPLASCPIASENHGSWPTSFELYATPAENCMTTATPAACLCEYTCACIAAHFTCPSGTLSCSSDPVQGIVVTCAS